MGDLSSMDKFMGRWEVTTTENMDEMLKASDIEEEKRQMYVNMKFIMEYDRDGDVWSYVVTMPNGMSKKYQYKVGEEYQSTTLDGRPIISKVDIADGKFVEIHRDKEDPTLDAKMVREVIGDELIVSAKVRNITSITRHKKI